MEEASAALPGPPAQGVEELRRQLEQLRVTISNQERTITELRAASSGASAPSPDPAVFNAADRLMEAVTHSIRHATTRGRAPQSDLAIHARTLANLLSNAPRYDGTSDVLLWRKRITDYLQRRRVDDETMALDVL